MDEDQLPPLNVGDSIWYPSDDIFLLGKVKQFDEEKVSITTKKGEHEFSREDVFVANPAEQDGVPDNTQLMNLHPPGILHNLKTRYNRDDIYTYTAHILIALNPYKRLPIYTDDLMFEYRGRYIGQLAPHVFAIGDRAYRSLIHDGMNQSVIVSGESGSGKTETSKYLMKYLLTVSTTTKSGRRRSQLVQGSLEDKIFETNPILEALGNAKTIRNNNSSRFGKFVKIHFESSGRACAASIATYLPEKSRLIFQAKDERNYHILYQLCAGAEGQEREDWQVKDAKDFAYLSNSGCFSVKDVDDAKEFPVVRHAMRLVGMEDPLQQKIFKLLSGILHLGNISFQDEDGDSSSVVAQEPVDATSALFGVDASDLVKKLTTRTVGVRSEVFHTPRTAQDAVYARDALAKALYVRLFKLVVDEINKSLEPQSGRGSTDDPFIGILDIYGFEVFEVNSFEQLCINYANETLQQLFIRNVFKQEQEIYRREAIRFQDISYRDNKDCITLLGVEPREGVFGTLDEQCRVPKATDGSFTTVVHERFSSNKYLSRPKVNRSAKVKLRQDEAFVIKHFAADVCYSTAGFLDKNNDALHEDLEKILYESSCEFVRGFSQHSPNHGSKKAFFRSVGSHFQKQLMALEDDLDLTVPNYIRCIKSNQNQRPADFDDAKIAEQLRASGMIEVVKLMHSGFPTRCHYDDLYSRYGEVMPPALRSMNAKDFVQALLLALDVPQDEYQLGVTRIFFRSGKMAFLEQLRGTTLPEEVAAKVKKWLARKRLRSAYVYISNALYVWKFMQRVSALRRFQKAAGTIVVYCQTFRRIYFRLRQAKMVTRLQAFARMLRVARAFRATRRAAVSCQRHVRGWQQRRRFVPVRDAHRQMLKEELERQRAAEKAAKRERWNSVVAEKTQKAAADAQLLREAAQLKQEIQRDRENLMREREEFAKQQHEIRRRSVLEFEADLSKSRASFLDTISKRLSSGSASLPVPEEGDETDEIVDEMSTSLKEREEIMIAQVRSEHAAQIAELTAERDKYKQQAEDSTAERDRLWREADDLKASLETLRAELEELRLTKEGEDKEVQTEAPAVPKTPFKSRLPTPRARTRVQSMNRTPVRSVSTDSPVPALRPHSSSDLSSIPSFASRMNKLVDRPEDYGDVCKKVDTGRARTADRRVAYDASPRPVTSPALSGRHVRRQTSTAIPVPSKLKNILRMGSRVRICRGHGNRCGVIKYIGETFFAPDVWYGVELDSPDGKNSGAVNGHTYFTCKPYYGVFVREHHLKLIT
eukprot:Rmarinus@m.122